MKLKVNEIIEKIENGEINWDNVYDIEVIDKENLSALEDYSNKKHLSQHSKKIRLNSLYGALANKYFFLDNRDMGGSVTMVGRTLIRFLGERLNDSLKKMFGENQNFLVYQDTDSAYLKIEPLAEKIMERMSKKFDDMEYEEKEKFLKSVIKFIETKIQLEIDSIIDDFLNHLNAFQKGFMGAKVEKINVSGIFVAKKKYTLKTIWNEGTILLKNPKISVTGIEVVRSSTPPFAIEKLKKALELLLDGKDLVDFLETTRKEFNIIAKQKPDAIARVSSINKLDYKKDKKGWYRIDENGKRIACPINSRGAMLYNKFVTEKRVLDTYQLIAEGDKIKFIKLKMPNPIGEDVIGYIDEQFLFDFDLVKYIDLDKTFEDIIIQPIINIVEVTNTLIERKDNVLNF